MTGTRVALVVAVGLAVALRLAHVWALRASPWWDHLVIDPEFYDAWAQRIAGGDWLGERAFYMDPLYPYLLGGLYRLLGRDLLAARLLNVACSAGTCLLVARLGGRVGGPVAGALAAFGFAFYEPEIFYVGEVDKTCLSVFLVAAALTLALERSRVARFGAGVALGLAALTRANLLVSAPIAALAFLRDPPARGGRAGGVALFVAGLATALLPVAWRNHHVSGEWIITTAQAGQNFYTGNNPGNPYGAYGSMPFVRGTPQFEEVDFRAEAERRTGHAMQPAEVSRFWFAESFRHMAERPAYAVAAFARKLALFWNDFEVSDNQDQYLMERDSWVLRLPLLGFGAVASLAALGALVAFRTSQIARILCGVVGIYCVSVVAFFIFSRYRIQVVPALLPLAAAGVLELGRRVRATAWQPLAVAVGIVVCAAFLTFPTIGLFARDHPLVTEMRLRHLGQTYLDTGHPDEALAAFHEGVAHCPTSCPLGLAALADAYLRTGRLAAGEAWFRELVRRYPTYPDGWAHLARLLQAQGRDADAADAAQRAGAPPSD